MPSYPERYNPSDDQHCRDLTQSNASHSAAWCLFINQLTGFARKYTLGYGFSTEEVDDLIVDTIAAFLERIHEGKYQCIGYKPITYVGKIFTNKVKESSRKRPNSGTVDIEKLEGDAGDDEQGLDSSPASPPLPAEPMPDDNCREKALEKGLAMLEPDERELLLLTGEIKEYAEKTGQNYGSLRVKKYRLMNRIKPIVWVNYTDCVNS